MRKKLCSLAAAAVFAGLPGLGSSSTVGAPSEVKALDAVSVRVGRLNIHFSDTVTTCSAFIVGPDLAATAGHCLIHKETGEIAGHVTFDPAVVNGDEYVYSREFSEEIFISKELLARLPPDRRYGGSLPHAAAVHDLALIRLRRIAGRAPVGAAVGVLRVAESFLAPAVQGEMLGYPDDRPRGTMWRARCRADVHAEFLAGDCAVHTGQSGSPFIVQGVAAGVVMGGNPQFSTIVRFGPRALADLRAIAAGGRADPPSYFKSFAARAPVYSRLRVRNNCASPVFLAIAYRTSDQRWVSRGYYRVAGGESLGDFHSDGHGFLYYATSPDGRSVWKGPHALTFKDKINSTLPARAVELPAPVADRSLDLNCP